MILIVIIIKLQNLHYNLFIFPPQEYGAQIFSLTTSLMNDLKDEGIVCILSLYETIIKVNLPQTIELMMVVLGQNLK